MEERKEGGLESITNLRSYLHYPSYLSLVILLKVKIISRQVEMSSIGQ